jgi:hypothetical protein
LIVRRLVTLLPLAVALAGCAGQLPLPVAADAARASVRWPGTTVANLQRGRELYVNRCSGCHALYRPQTFPADKWRGIVVEMTDRSKLAPDDAETVIRYLTAAADAH